MTTKKTRTIVWSYLDFLDPNRTYVVPNGYSRICIASYSCDWGETAQRVGYSFILNNRGPNGASLPIVTNNDRWFTPQAPVVVNGENLKDTFPGSYYQSYSITYSTRVPPFVSLVIEGVDAPDNRVAIITPNNNSMNNGITGPIYNIVDRNFKIRLLDAWNHLINNMTLSVTIILLE